MHLDCLLAVVIRAWNGIIGVLKFISSAYMPYYYTFSVIERNQVLSPQVTDEREYRRI